MKEARMVDGMVVTEDGDRVVTVVVVVDGK